MAQGNRIKIFQGRDPHTKFSANKIVIGIRSFLKILYHSITTKVVAIHIQASEAVIQDVFLYHSSITSEIWSFWYMIKNQCAILFLFLKEHIKESNKQM